MKRFSKYMSFKIEISLIPLLQAITHIFEISEDDHPLKIVGHARDHWWTLDFANAFVSPGVNSRGELVPRPELTPGMALRAVGSGTNIKHFPCWYTVISTRVGIGKTRNCVEIINMDNVLYFFYNIAQRNLNLKIGEKLSVQFAKALLNLHNFNNHLHFPNYLRPSCIIAQSHFVDFSSVRV
jgi:hypothetical protein